jgi:pyruvate dehydrogenase E2 component (dihydrolipoamide acetyltransferase)
VRAQFWQRIAESKPAVPHFYLTVDCAIDRLLELQGDLNRRMAGLGPELTIDDFILRAAALSLVEYPRANAVWCGDHIRLYRSVDIAFVVGSSGGSAMPVLRDAGGKGLSALASESRVLTAKVQDGTLTPELCEGGSFTIFHLAAHGIRTFQAIIPTSHACALAIGAPQQAVVVRDGKIAQATIMSCSLSVDHRVVDGSLGAELLAAFKRRIEDPLLMLL